MGRLGFPIMLAMAALPFIGAWAFEKGGGNWMIGILNALALLNVALVTALWLFTRSHRKNA
jgi:cation transport ATPase